MTKPHVLYRAFNGQGQLLYIGITLNPAMRFSQHGYGQPWWTDVAEIEMQQFPSREAVMEAERSAILDEKPMHNVLHNKSQAVMPAVKTQTAKSHCVGKRRTKGSGTIRQLPSGKWQAKIRHGGTERLAPHTFDTKLDADKWLSQQLNHPIQSVTVFDNFDSLPGWSA